MTRRRLWAGSAALAVTGLAAEWAALQRHGLEQAVQVADVRRAGADLVTGWIVGACGLAGWRLRPGRALGPLLTASAAAWFLGTLSASGVSWLADLGAALVLAHRGPFVHALIATPQGRGAGTIGTLAVAAGYVLVIPGLGDRTAGEVVLAMLLIGALAWRFAHAPPRDRLALYPPLAIATAFAGAVFAGALTPYELVVAGGAAWLLIDLLRARWTESAVAGLVLELGRGAAGPPLERRLAGVLGDPTLRLAYRLPGREGFTDGAGRPVSVTDGDPGRRVTTLGGDEPIAALIHDAAAVTDPVLLDSVAAVARIAVSNAQLQAAVRERLDELVASRRRIVEAADAQRQRLERRLRAGPQAQLAQVGEALAACRDAGEPPGFAVLLDEAVADVRQAADELTQFARGVRPRLLSEGGIEPAVAELAAHAPMPVTVTAPRARFDAAVEAVAYFVCAEALANAGKHAGASSAAIVVARDGPNLAVVVADDGRGGADMAAGTGLRGLRDRVEALGGVLTVDSRPGGGTRLRALLPLERT